MRTTIRLDDQLLSDAKKYALETGRTLTAFIEDAVRTALARPALPSKPRRTRLTTFRGDGLQPGVSLDDSAGLRDIMGGL